MNISCGRIGIPPMGGSQIQPSSLAGLVLWLRADLGVTLNAGNVAAWGDQSGNGNHATQGLAGNQPAYSAAGLNGRPAVDWGAGAASRNLVTPSISYGVRTILAVIRASATSGYLLVHNADGADGEYIYCLSGASFSLARGGVRSSKNVSATWLADGVARSVAVTYGGSHATHLAYRNGVLDGATTVVGGDPGVGAQAGLLYLGSNQTGGGGYKGLIGEIIIYSRVISADELSALETYLRGFWGVLMPRPAVVFNARVLADTFAAQVNAALGYPRAGADIGVGIHAPAAMSSTIGYAAAAGVGPPPEWAVMNDPEVDAEITTRPPPGLAAGTRRALDDSWFGTSPRGVSAGLEVGRG